MSFRDIVIAGPDMSGTSTQVQGVIDHLVAQGLTYRDLRGGEDDALFHAEIFNDLNQDYPSLDDFLKSASHEPLARLQFFEEARNLPIASMVENDVSTFVNPKKANIWVLEEPTNRGAGQVCRTIEHNRGRYGLKIDGVAEAMAHQAYRSEEFMRFRRVLREQDAIIVRSRSEESGAYQIYDKERMPTGPLMIHYLSMPGHQIAFAHAPTDIVIVHAPEDWTPEEYLELRKQRSGGRVFDGIEANVGRQLLVNKRYATSWMEAFYKQGIDMHGGTMPNIHRIAMYDSRRQPRSKEEIQEEINGLL